LVQCSERALPIAAGKLVAVHGVSVRHHRRLPNRIPFHILAGELALSLNVLPSVVLRNTGSVVDGQVSDVASTFTLKCTKVDLVRVSLRVFRAVQLIAASTALVTHFLDSILIAKLDLLGYNMLDFY